MSIDTVANMGYKVIEVPVSVSLRPKVYRNGRQVGYSDRDHSGIIGEELIGGKKTSYLVALNEPVPVSEFKGLTQDEIKGLIKTAERWGWISKEGIHKIVLDWRFVFLDLKNINPDEGVGAEFSDVLQNPYNRSGTIVDVRDRQGYGNTKEAVIRLENPMEISSIFWYKHQNRPTGVDEKELQERFGKLQWAEIVKKFPKEKIEYWVDYMLHPRRTGAA